jgi:hypothetical protein
LLLQSPFRFGSYPDYFAMPNADAEKKEWPVHLYRKKEAVWERVRPKKPNGRPGVVKAEPQRGSVLLDRVRVRIWLSSKPAGSRRGEDPTTKNAVVVRRHDFLLISYHGGGKSLVVKFRDLASCLEFSDLLVRLNPPLARTILAATASANSSNAVPMTPAAVDTARESSTNGEGPQRAAAITTASHNESIAGDEYDLQMRSYIGRLLLDEDFPKLVDSVEACIRRSADGGHLLAGLMNNNRRSGSGSSSTATANVASVALAGSAASETTEDIMYS